MICIGGCLHTIPFLQCDYTESPGRVFTYCQDGQQILDWQLWLQPLLEHANSLVLQVIVGGNAAISKRLNGALILDNKIETCCQQKSASDSKE